MADSRQTSIFMGDETPSGDSAFLGEPRLSVKDVTSMLGISRTTLLWYEKAGVVQPVHDERSGWRKYSDADVLRLMGAMLLKNSGMAFREQGAKPEDYAFTREKIDEYIAYSENQQEYYAAQAECLQSIQKVIEKNGTMEVGSLETFFFYPFSASGGGSDSLVRSMPITALGGVAKGAWGEPMALRRGRTVQARFAHLVDAPKKGRETIGGCTCLCSVLACDGTDDSQIERDKVLGEMQEYMDAQGLVPCGNLIIPRFIPLGKGYCAALCVPVKPACV